MKKTTRLLARALVIAAAVAGANTITSKAIAQDDVATQMARERFQEGVKYYDQKQYEKARAAFLQAYALKKHPAVLLNLAQSELRSGHEADAATHFARYLREASGSATERAEAEKGLRAAKVKVAEFAVTVEVAGAEVHVDGKFEGRSPLPGPIYLAPGNHSLEARKDGKTATLSVTATAGQNGKASLTFSSPSGAGAVPVGPAGPDPGPDPGAGPGPGSGPGGPPGGGSGASGSIGFDSGDERQAFFSWFGETPVAWVGAGVTGLGLVGGIAFAVSSSSNYDSADSLRNQIVTDAQANNVSGPCNPQNALRYGDACQKFQDRVDSGDSQKTLSTVSFVVAGLAAGGTVAYYFLDSKKKPKAATGKAAPKRSIAVVPMVAPSFGGLGVMGQL